MFKLLLSLFLLISACVAIHGLGMVLGVRWLGRASARQEDSFSLTHTFWLLVRVVYGLLVLTHEWWILGAMEAVTGVLMFGWSTGVLFTIVHHFHSHFLRSRMALHTRHDNAGHGGGAFDFPLIC